MAASRPRDAHLKEKSSSASSVPPHTDTLHWRRTTRPSVPGSPNRDLRSKPTASKSTTGVSRAGSQPPSNATAGRRVPIRNPDEKPPSPSGPPRRAPTPSTLKGKTVRASSSLPNAAISSKPALDKASKPLKSTRTQPLVRAKSSEADTGTPAPSTTEAPPAMKSEQEEEPEIQVEKSEPVDIPEVKDDAPDELDFTDSSEPNITEDTTDSASQTDQREPSSPKAEIEIATANDEGVGGDGNKADEDREIPTEPEEKPAIESSEEPESEPGVDGGNKPEEAEAEEATAVGSSETKRPEVVAFKRPEVAGTGRKKDAPRSNDVIEEARSKLLEKRKSKVLALVGAFETVISLRGPEGQSGQTKGKSEDEGA